MQALLTGWLTFTALFVAPIVLGAKWIDWFIYHYIDFEHYPLVLRAAHVAAPFLAGLVVVSVSRTHPAQHALVLALLCLGSVVIWDILFRHFNDFPPSSTSPSQVLWYACGVALIGLGALFAEVWRRRAA